MKKQVSRKKQEKIKKTPRQTQGNKNLYQALMSIYQFSKFEDLLLLKNKYFLSLCEVAYIGWDLEEKFFKNTVLFKRNNNKHSTASPYWLRCPLDYNNVHYGYLSFVSSHKISKTKKNFLIKITHFVASSLHYIENKKHKEQKEHDWEVTFNSFYQALCITDKNFKIIRSNQSFRHLVKQSKQNLIGADVFKKFPFPIHKELNSLGEGSWISKQIINNKTLGFKFTVKNIFLTNKNIYFSLVLVEDISQQIQMEEAIAHQAKDRDIGLIKASIAHQLNNPIAGIKMLVHVIENSLSKKDQKKQEDLFLEHIFKDMNQAVLRCQNIIENLLSMSYSKNNTSKEVETPREIKAD